MLTPPPNQDRQNSASFSFSPFRIRTAKLAALQEAGQNSVLTKSKGDRVSIGTKIVNFFYGDSEPAAVAPADPGSGGAAASEPSKPEEAAAALPPDGGGEDDDEFEGPQHAGTAFLRRSKAMQLDSYDLSMLATVDTGHRPCIVNPRIWWRHPLLRLIAVWSILFLDFFIYAVDPAQDSHVTYAFFGVAEDFFVLKWPEKLVHQISRVVLFIVVSLIGFLFGRFVIHHKFLRDLCGLQMFSENNGTLIVDFLVWVICFEMILPYPVNLIESGTTTGPITEPSVYRYAQWGKFWQTTAAIADTLAIVTISDAVMQDRTVWPEFAPRLKRIWNDAAGGWVRVIAAWAGFFVMLPLIVYGLWCNDKTNGIYDVERVRGLRTTQWMRVSIASFLTCVDITTVLQDWEFPSFNSPLDFKVVGSFSNVLEIKCLTNLARPISKVITCIPEAFWENFHFKMSGKWLAYLPALGALLMDLYYLVRTIFAYDPLKFAQYAGPDCTIYIIMNETTVDRLFKDGSIIPETADQISWDARQGYNAPGERDRHITSRYCGSPGIYSILALSVGLLAGFAFVVLIIRAEYYWDNYFKRNEDGLQGRIEEYYEDASERREGRHPTREVDAEEAPGGDAEAPGGDAE